MIYLDNNATTPVHPDVATAMAHGLKALYANPSSSHVPGKLAHDAVEAARASVARLLGCEPNNIVFTSGGTESNNLSILGTAARHASGHIITSSIEHPAVLNPLRHLEKRGFEVTFIAVDGSGRVSADKVNEAIRGDTFLITIMHANNETGAIQPIEKIGVLARQRGVPFHTDAAQSAGKIPLEAADADMVTVAAHKFYGPKGMGALYIREGISLEPIMFGASHERGLRPGTENVPGILGLGKACEIAVVDMKDEARRQRALRDILLARLKEKIPGLRVNSLPEYCLPGTLNVSLSGVAAQNLVDALANTVAISAGSACHEGKSEPSQVLKAMGLSDEEALSAVRISIGRMNSGDDVRKAAEEICRQYLRLLGQEPSSPSACPA